MRDKIEDKALHKLSATEAISLIKQKKLSAAELVRVYLDRIARYDEQVKAWVFLDRESALRQAELVDSRIAEGVFKGALYGTPVGVKDIFNTVDMPTCMGSPLYEGFTPGNDARVVSMLRHAGATIPGKTVTAEFAVHALDKTVNPHNFCRSPGTSSSGSAAAVAAGMVPFAVGTQTAGSIIRPASYCGVYGFKPSFGMIPRTGMLKTTDSLDQVGYFANSVEDLSLMFDVVRLKGLDYPLNDAAINDGARQSVSGRPWRVGVVSSSLWVWDQAADYAKNALAGFCEKMRFAGFEVDDLVLPETFNGAHHVHETIYDKTLAYYFKEEHKNNHLFSGVLNDMIRHGQDISLEQYKDALGSQAALAAQLESLFNNYDVVVTLSTAGTAPQWGGVDIPDSCLIWSLCGVPVISMPVFFGPDGMPFGAQVLARRRNDRLLLSFVEHLRELRLLGDAKLAELGLPVTTPHQVT